MEAFKNLSQTYFIEMSTIALLSESRDKWVNKGDRGGWANYKQIVVNINIDNYTRP